MDHYQVRRYESWYRDVTLAMLALAFLAISRATLAEGRTALASSANEISRMFTVLCAPLPDEQHARRWSRWRRRHQDRARRRHYQHQRLRDH